MKKKVGNACRTKNQIKNSKSRGNQFEMNCQHSLKPSFKDIVRLGGEGQYRELDLESKEQSTVFECKRHKGFSWNELIKYFNKLEIRGKNRNHKYLLFRANQQPCLVMFRSTLFDRRIMVTTFEDYFKLKFEKHKTIKRGKKDEKEKI